MKLLPLLCVTVLLGAGLDARGTVDDAQSFALEAAAPYVRQGYVIRQESWNGRLGAGATQIIRHQLFKGNAYWFWAAVDGRGAAISVHLYDRSGRLVETKSWSRPFPDGCTAGARVVPVKTDSYFAVIKMERAPGEALHWSLCYGFR